MTENSRLNEALALAAQREMEALTDLPAPEGTQAFAASLRRCMQNSSSARVKKAPRALLIAALMVMVFSSAAALSPVILRELLRLELTYANDTIHAEVTPAGDWAEVPENWFSVWYLTWLPEGYSLSQVKQKQGSEEAIYTNGGSRIRFQCMTSGFMQLDRNGAELIDMQVRGLPATRWQHGDTWRVLWQDGRHILLLSASGETEENVLRVAEGMVTLLE